MGIHGDILGRKRQWRIQDSLASVVFVVVVGQLLVVFLVRGAFKSIRDWPFQVQAQQASFEGERHHTDKIL